MSGIVRTREIKITTEQLEQFNNGRHIQWLCPNLSTDDREFLMTGIIQEEWDETFKEIE